jgi:hypothetical protein
MERKPQHRIEGAKIHEKGIGYIFGVYGRCLGLGHYVTCILA